MSRATSIAPKKILVIRSDNIGDLVCTTPLLTALRQRFPTAWIGVLASEYNHAVLRGNPDIDAVYAYRKAKHRSEGENALGVYTERTQLILELRRQRIDDVVLAGSEISASAWRFTRWVGPKRVLCPGSGLRPFRFWQRPPQPVADESTMAGGHEVERVFARLAPYGIVGRPPSCRVYPDPESVEPLRRRLESISASFSAESLEERPLIALHISARKPSQRWPLERFAALARTLHERENAAFLLFWAPGEADNPKHPGDDEKAAALVQMLDAPARFPLIPVPTHELSELIAGLSLCDRIICADGGALHLAAGLGKPVIALFGQSDPARWRPWAVPHVCLQKPECDVTAIGVEDVLAAEYKLTAGRLSVEFVVMNPISRSKK